MKRYKHIWFSKNNQKNIVSTGHGIAMDYFTSEKIKEGVTPDEMINMLGNNDWEMCGVSKGGTYTMYYFKREEEPQYHHLWINCEEELLFSAHPDVIKIIEGSPFKPQARIPSNHVIDLLGKNGYQMCTMSQDGIVSVYWFVKKIS